MGRPTKHARVNILAQNIFLGGKKFHKGDTPLVLRAEAKSVIKADKDAGRAPRIEVVKNEAG